MVLCVATVFANEKRDTAGLAVVRIGVVVLVRERCGATKADAFS